MNDTATRAGEIRIHDSTVGVWEEEVQTESMKVEVLDPLVRHLRSMGWTVGRDKEMHRHYRSLSKYARHGMKLGLEVRLYLMGRHLEVLFFQNVANVTHPSGGRYEFDKLRGMPYLLRKRAELTMGKVVAFLVGLHGYKVVPEQQDHYPGGISGRQWIEERNRSSWHFKEELGHAAYTNGNRDRTSADGVVLEHGQVVWFRGEWRAPGRLLRGIAYYNLNNMWWVLCGPWSVHNVANFHIYARPPQDLKGRWFSAYERQRRIEPLLRAAVLAMDFDRAKALKKAVLGEGTGRLTEGWQIEAAAGEVRR